MKFFEGFTTVLEGLITRKSQLIILGDFNIHVEDHVDSHSIQFSELLKQFGLHQHVRKPTSVRGGTLALSSPLMMYQCRIFSCIRRQHLITHLWSLLFLPFTLSLYMPSV